MTLPVTPFSQVLFSPLLIPALPSLNLSESEQQLIGWLQTRAWLLRQQMELRDVYYRGVETIESLGIAIPPQLQDLRSVVGWPAKAVDPIADRLSAQGFRLESATDSDADLRDIWVANDMDAEQTLGYVDALVMGRSFLTVGSPMTPGDAPVVCVESPLNMSVSWDVRSQTPKAVLQTYWVDEQMHAALYLPDQTIHMGADDRGQWQITDRDMHDFGAVPVIRMANRPRSNNRDGSSEITPVVMSLTDAACRALTNLVVSGELYSVPQKYILGATEKDFQNADGSPKAAWQTYISHILAIENDDAGEQAKVGQFAPYDPSVFTKVLDWFASAMGSEIDALPQDLGLYTQGNPTAADSIRFMQDNRYLKTVRKQNLFGCALVKAMQMAMMFVNGGVLPDEFRRMEVDWEDPATPTPAATTDAITKQIAAGSVPATSDVVLKRLGYSAVERARLAQDRANDEGEQFLAELSKSIVAKEAKVDQGLAVDVDTPPAPIAPGSAAAASS